MIMKVSALALLTTLLLLTAGCGGDIKFDEQSGKIIPAGDNTTGIDGENGNGLEDPLTSKGCTPDEDSSDDEMSEDGCSADDGSSSDETA